MIEYILEDENINIFVGENAKDNWELLDNANQNFIWLHLNNLSSPHVIINSVDPTKKTLRYAANLCKYHSKYSGVKKLKIIYTTVKNVKKGIQIGSVTIKGKVKEILV
tara:strand:- start:55 stop:378 length:324 start_codon:yes stop_codon:yes gene_type:complete